MTHDVQAYCAGCITCQQYKGNCVKLYEEPLPIPHPERHWGFLAMNFITYPLPATHRFNAIAKTVDRFSRQLHFMPARDRDTAINKATLFFIENFWLHGLPNCIMSDRDPRFMSDFWEKFIRLCDMKLRMSGSHHPLTDGTSEIINRMVESFPRCYCVLNQDNWNAFSSSAQFSFNILRLDTAEYTPFQLDLGWNPPRSWMCSALSPQVQYKASKNSGKH